ncbi:MAG: hypothetical protein P1U32_04540 [Legionellaceae bacterium]|nr:hypothetical protein [Legionellaceae bacterium]
MPHNTVRRIPKQLQEVVRTSFSKYKDFERVLLGNEPLSFKKIDTSGYVAMTLVSNGRLNTIPIQTKTTMSEKEKRSYQFNQLIQRGRLEILEGSGREGRGDGVFIHPLNTKRDDKLPHSEILAMFLLEKERPAAIFSTQEVPYFMPYASPLSFAGVYHHDHPNVKDGWLQVSGYIATRNPEGLITIHDPLMWNSIVQCVQEELKADAEVVAQFYETLFPDENQDIPLLDKLKQIAKQNYGGIGGDTAERAALQRAELALKALERTCYAINAVNASVDSDPITNPFALSDDEPDFTVSGPRLGNES